MVVSVHWGTLPTKNPGCGVWGVRCGVWVACGGGIEEEGIKQQRHALVRLGVHRFGRDQRRGMSYTVLWAPVSLDASGLGYDKKDGEGQYPLNPFVFVKNPQVQYHNFTEELGVLCQVAQIGRRKWGIAKSTYPGKT